MGGRRDVSAAAVPGAEKMGSVDGARGAVPQRSVPEQRLMAELNLMAGGAATPSKKELTKKSKCQTLSITEKMKARLPLLMGQDGVVADDKARKASSMTKLRRADAVKLMRNLWYHGVRSHKVRTRGEN